LILTHDLHLKVIDFGTAKFYNEKIVPAELLQKIKEVRA